MGTYERKIIKLRILMIKKYKQTYDKSKGMSIDIGSITYLPQPDVFDVMPIDRMSIILDEVNKIIDENKDKLTNPTCATIKKKNSPMASYG